MFLQVIEGHVGDREGFRRQLDRWLSDLSQGASGWLGTTSGVTEDGTFVAAVRFDSEEAARANSDRPEQGAWWDETKGYFDGEVRFVDCPQVDTFGAGGSDDAGFVQVMQGRADRDQVLAEVAGLEEVMRRMRPDVIGGIIGWPGDGTFTQLVYFTSEAEARKGEQAEPAPEDAQAMAKLDEIIQVDRYIDLREPLLFSP